jgi:hypothetical protein
MTIPVALCLGLASGAAWAQDQPASPAPEAKQVPPAPGDAAKQVQQKKINVEEPEVAASEKGAQIGVGARFRYIFMPSAVLNLFLGHSTSMSSVAVGGEVIRRKGNLDIVFGLEWANVSPKDGLYLEKGKDPSIQGDYPDFVHFDSFSMISLDGTFVWHTELTDFLQLRYGAGIGIGFLLGNIVKTKTTCSSTTTVDQLDDPNVCMQSATSRNADKPPVVPIVNLLLGLRIKLVEQLSANVEIGFRDVFFGGLSVGYFF